MSDRICEYRRCDDSLDGKRSNARFCSDGCGDAERAEKRRETPNAAPRVSLNFVHRWQDAWERASRQHRQALEGVH